MLGHRAKKILFTAGASEDPIPLNQLWQQRWLEIASQASAQAEQRGGSSELTNYRLVLFPPPQAGEKITVLFLGPEAGLIETGWTARISTTIATTDSGPDNNLIPILISIMSGHAYEYVILRRNHWVGCSVYVPYPGGAIGRPLTPFNWFAPHHRHGQRQLPRWPAPISETH